MQFIEAKISNFIERHGTSLPTNSVELNQVLYEAETLLTYWESTNANTGVPPAVHSLMRLTHTLKTLSRQYEAQDERTQQKRRALTQSEKLTVASLENSIASYRAQLADNPTPLLRESLEACLTVAEQEYENVVNVRVTARQAALRQKELQRELMQQHVNLERAQKSRDVKAQANIRTQIAAIEEELARA